MKSKNRTYHPRNERVDGYNVGDHPLYKTWSNMLSRCHDPNQTGYENYGGRGITVCEEWHHFKNFARDMGSKSSELSIERIDNSKGYSKENCKWDTRSNQCVNRRIFKNNTSGYRGVVKTKSGYNSRFDYEGQRYLIGWFKTKEEADANRKIFIDLFFTDKAAALKMITPKARSISKTKERGINPHSDGGYVVRCQKNGERVYLGYYLTLQGAVNARDTFLATGIRPSKQTSC
jgi:hypothetical protein